MSTILHLSIDYDEAEASSYRGVVLSTSGKEHARWASGDPQADWASYLAWRDEQPSGAFAVLETSSVTHFLFDVPGWRMIEDGRGREIIVPEDRPGHDIPTTDETTS